MSCWHLDFRLRQTLTRYKDCTDAALTVVDEGGRPEPELRAAFACGVHDAEVVDTRPQHGAVSGAQLGDAAQQDLHPLAHKPTEQRRQQRHQSAESLSLSTNDLSVMYRRPNSSWNFLF